MPEEQKKEAKAPEKPVAPEEKEKQELLSKGKVSIIIDSYNDLFSDFDSRDYSKRSLSDDFLREAKKISVEEKEAFELRFIIPKSARKLDEEKIIKKRLKEHFKKHYKVMSDEADAKWRNSIILVVAGFLMMVGATLIRVMEDGSLLFIVLLVVLEPAGWFSLWFGLDQLVYSSKERKLDHEFYAKMHRAEIIFEEY